MAEKSKDADVQEEGEEEGEGEEKSSWGKKARLVAGDVAPYAKRW